MKIILVEQVKKLGGIGDVVIVKDGYARNFLIPNKKAMRATKDNVEYFEVKKAEIKAENEKKILRAGKHAKTVDGLIVSLIRQAGEDGRLYGSVNAAAIAKVVSDETNQEIRKKSIILNDPIKYIGIQTITIELHAEVSATVHINIARSEGEAEIAKKKFQKVEVAVEEKEAEEKEVA